VHHFDPNFLQFYLTIPSPCPYLPGQTERKIFTQMDPISGDHLNDYLTHAGFRRSQSVIYRPTCEHCKSCQSLRVLTQPFTPTRSFKRTLSRNRDIRVSVLEPYATQEQFDLLKVYLNNRHRNGGMSNMDISRYEMMIEDCTPQTEIVEYRDPDDRLIALALVDRLSDGFSMVYSFFDPTLKQRSLGNYMILEHIMRSKTHNLPFLYLGYWVKGSQKMNYKARFQPCEVLGPKGWCILDAQSEPPLEPSSQPGSPVPQSQADADGNTP